MPKIDFSFVSKLAFLVATAILLASAVAISRDYQDSWVLEGLEVPYVFFVISYVFAFFSEKKVSRMVILAIIGRCVFLLIPSLKYVWFQGTAVDQQVQYSLANHVYSEGYIMQQGSFNVGVYATTPSIHLILGIFSLMLGMPVVGSMKYIPVLLSPLYPILTYVIVKNLKLLHSSTALKYALLISSVPVIGASYLVTGSQFGIRLSFLVLTTLVLLLSKGKRSYWLLFVFFNFTLAMTHSASSIIFTAEFLVLTMLLLGTSYFQARSHLRAPIVLAVTSICGAWLMFRAKFTIEGILRTIFAGIPSGVAPVGGFVPSRFFELASVDIFGAAKSMIVYDGGTALLLLLATMGLITLLRKKRNTDSTSRLISAIGIVMLVFILIGFISMIGGFRAIYFASAIFPILCGVFFAYVSRRKIWIHAAIFLLIMLFATLEFYGCQPLIPSANTLSKNLPTSEPLVYVTVVNSIYQRQMIRFAESYTDGRIASDSITSSQISGLTELNFSDTHLTHYYALDSDRPSQEFDYFLIHTPGAAGGFQEQAEVRTADSIIQAIDDLGTIYTNGESYILIPSAGD